MTAPTSDTVLIHQRVWDLVAAHWRPNAVFGHGPDHAERAYKTALRLAGSTSADPLPVGAACYLMDAGLSLEHGRKDHVSRSLEIAKHVFTAVPELRPVEETVLQAIQYHEAEDKLPDDCSIEVAVVSDSDTLDRLGLTGVRMTLKYGQWIGRQLCHEDDPLCVDREPSLDGYTLDYLRYLTSLGRCIATTPAKELAAAKLREIDAFFGRFENEWSIGRAPTYKDCFTLVGAMLEDVK